jgi:hypothetical protein
MMHPRIVVERRAAAAARVREAIIRAGGVDVLPILSADDADVRELKLLEALAMMLEDLAGRLDGGLMKKKAGK